jgi:hypothetical protein
MKDLLTVCERIGDRVRNKPDTKPGERHRLWAKGEVKIKCSSVRSAQTQRWEKKVMARRSMVVFIVAAVLVLLIFGLRTPSIAAMKTVELSTPGCV